MGGCNVALPLRFQSTLPRGERQEFDALVGVEYLISIHAPARGATFILTALDKIDGFQSTLPRGERRHIGKSNIHILLISIHAPARGATSIPLYIQDNPKHFNPRSREGSDVLLILQSPFLCHFNPRSREGSDHS